MSEKTVIFDLDHTLFKKNGSFQFGWYLYQKKKISGITLFKLFFYYFACKAGLLSLETLHQKAFALFFQGKPLSFFEDEVESFLDSHGNELYNPTIVSHFHRAKEENQFTVLLSNSPDFLVQAVANRLGFDVASGSTYNHDEQGIIRSFSRNMDGAEKRLFAQGLSCQPENLVAYSDSHIDLPLLELVGTPIAVQPTRTLRKLAKERAWPILES